MQQVKRELNLASLIKDYANYNHWANKQLVEWLRTKPSQKMEQEVASSFPSIEKTLMHMWGTERFWLSVFKQVPAPASLTEIFKGNIGDVFNGMLKQSEEVAQYVNSLSETSIKVDCNLDTPWVKGIRPRFEFIHHLLNHSTYHRGQIVTIGRNVGLTDAPMTDFNFYSFYGKSVLPA